jgi:hypothetical protein
METVVVTEANTSCTLFGPGPNKAPSCPRSESIKTGNKGANARKTRPENTKIHFGGSSQSMTINRAAVVYERSDVAGRILRTDNLRFLDPSYQPTGYVREVF